MPKISSAKIYFEGRQFDRNLSVDAEGEFSMLLPAEIVQATGKQKVFGDTKAEVECKWLQMVKEWKQSKVEKRKVLAVKYKQQRKSRHAGDQFADDGICLEIVCYPFEETATTNGNGEVRHDYKGLDPDDYGLPEQITEKGHSMIRSYRGEKADADGDIILLPLTPEAGAFMADLEARLLGLQDKLQSILSSEEKIKQAIAAGAAVALLEAPTQKKVKNK